LLKLLHSGTFFLTGTNVFEQKCFIGFFVKADLSGIDPLPAGMPLHFGAPQDPAFNVTRGLKGLVMGLIIETAAREV
jgi:hypothetical protein